MRRRRHGAVASACAVVPKARALLVGWLLLLLGCGGAKHQGAARPPTQSARVKVEQAGQIYFNGEAVTFDELRLKLAQARAAGWGIALQPTGDNPQAQKEQRK